MRRRTVLQGLVAAAGASLVPSAWGETKPGRWLMAESPNFILYSTEPDDQTRAEIIALERYHALMLRLKPRAAQDHPKISIFIAASRRDMAATAPWADTGVAGFYHARLEQVRAVTLPDAAESLRGGSAGHRTLGSARTDDRPLDAGVILFHEYAHHVARTDTTVVYPPWYQEGFAEFLSTAEFTDTTANIGKFTLNRASWLANGSWLDINTFLGGLPDRTTTDDIAQFYAQAWLATHYLFGEKTRAAGFNKYCAALQNGGDPLGAFEPAFGITPAVFDKELRDYKRKAINSWQFPDKPTDMASKVTLTRLESAADDILMPLSYLKSLPDAADADRAIATIRVEAKKYPDSLFANRAHALLEIWYGDLGVARTKLDALLLKEPQNPETLHLSGLCDLRSSYAAQDQDLAKKAKKSFAAAQRLDPTRAGSLFRYFESSLMETGEVSQHLLDVLVTAYNLSPQVDDIALNAAQALIAHKQFEDAIYILRPMVGDVHNTGRAEIAKQLIDAAKAEQIDSFILFGSASGTDDEE